jgi:hypothetical protein
LSFWPVDVNSLRLSRRRCRVSPSILAGIPLCAVAIIGCQLTSAVEYTNPSDAEQSRAVLNVVHIGMTREQAMDALTNEGVQGSTGVSESVYYCDAWDGDDDRHWHLNVALFFDQSGRLYKVGSSQPEIGSETDIAPSDAELSDGSLLDDSTRSR